MIWDQLLTVSASVTAVTVIATAAVRVVRFWMGQKRQDTEIEQVKHEMGVICYGVLACLDGLKQMGCNGNVTKAKNALEEHLNKTAHK